MNRRYQIISDLPKSLPMFPLSGALLLPRTDLPLSIFEPRYLEMVEVAMAGNRLIGIIQPQADQSQTKPKLMHIGCAGRITSYSESEDGRIHVTLTGICRFVLGREARVETPYRQAAIDFRPFAIDLVSGAGAPSVDRAQVLDAFRQYLELNNLTTNWEDVNAVNTEVLVNTLSLLAPYPPRDKQALLEAPDLKTRAEVLVALTELALKKSLHGNSTRMQ